jgi:AmiR/NasT family two-component response regulator
VRLAAGLDAAFKVRILIQQAIGVLMERLKVFESEAYLQLRLRAAELRTGLPEAATAVVTQYRRS